MIKILSFLSLLNEQKQISLIALLTYVAIIITCVSPSPEVAIFAFGFSSLMHMVGQFYLHKSKTDSLKDENQFRQLAETITEIQDRVSALSLQNGLKYKD